MTPEAWSAIADCVMAGAAVAAAIAAFRGLKAWKKQETWREDTNLARRMLVALEVYRAAARFARRPIFRPDEYRLGEVSSERAMSLRWHEVVRAKAELTALNNEARALWNDLELASAFLELEDLDIKLDLAIIEHSRLERVCAEAKTEAEKAQAISEMGQQRAFLYHYGKEDEFGEKFSIVVQHLEQLLRSKLGRS